jgi:hypothetical protein
VSIIAPMSVIYNHFAEGGMYLTPPAICLYGDILHGDRVPKKFCYLNYSQHTIKADAIRFDWIF